MSNLMDQAILDTKNILDDVERGFARNVTITNLQSQVQTIPGFVIRVSQEIDPDTQIPVVSQKTAISIHSSNITIGTPVKGWLVSFSDFSGEIISGKVIRIEREKTFGYVSLILGV
jgi:hypothetical protein